MEERKCNSDEAHPARNRTPWLIWPSVSGCRKLNPRVAFETSGDRSVMTSPFPGVDPYIEAQDYWPDFHSSFINYWRDALNDVLPDHYEARIDERLTLIEQPAERVKRIEPDLIITRRGSSRGVLAAPAGVGIIEPVTVPLIIEEETRETFIEIRRRPERTVVATLELLSPANKEEPGRRSYLEKRNALLPGKSTWSNWTCCWAVGGSR